MSATPTPFVPFADQGMYLAHTAGGQQAVIQLLWRYRRPVDLAALTRFRDCLAQGPLARLMRPALLPFGRHQWAMAPPPSAPLSDAVPQLAPAALQPWADAQVELPLDPAQGPAWTFTLQPFTDGSTAVSLVVSHCIADGMATALAVSEAARGERRPLSYPAASSSRTPAALGAELLRTLQDAPAAARALAQLTRMALGPRSRPAGPAPPPAASGDEGTIVYPSAFLSVPTALWDATARSRGANRLTLIAAVTAAFAEALGRVRGGETTLLIPVNQREGLSDDGGNRVSLATLKIASGEPRSRLHALQRRLQAALIRTRREPDPLAAMLPLVPFVPRRAFAAAGALALGTLAELPVTCSHMGDLPPGLVDIDGAPSDHFCFRGVDRQVQVRAVTARHGVATLLSGTLPGILLLNFVAYQPGAVTQPSQLRPLVKDLLATYGIAGAFFDD